MKKLLFLLICFCAVYTANAQRVGVKLGITTYDVTPQDVNIVNGTDSLQMSLTEAGYGVHGGIFGRFDVGGLYIQADALLGSSSMTYTLDSLSSVGSQLVEDRKNFVNLTVPLTVGKKFADLLRIYGGVVGSLTLNNQSDLFDTSEYSSQWNSLTWGYQAGVGLDIKSVTIDAAFQGAINRFGNDVTVGGNTYTLDDRPTSFVVSLGYMF